MLQSYVDHDENSLKEVLDGVADFLLQDNVSRPSSCRSVVIDGEETPVRYWQDSIKGVIQQYLLEFPDGIKRTYIYAHIPKNFRSNSLLAGLCNLCEDSGYANFATLEKMAQNHSSCLEHCMRHALDSCQNSHNLQSTEFCQVYKIYEKISAAISNVPSDNTEKYKSQLEEFMKTFWVYIGHIIRTKHQGEYYRFVLNNLKAGEAVVIIDYKMKVELGMHAREIQRDWYGKRGISLHGFYVVAQVSDSERKIDVLDLWSDDTKQDAWFTQSALDIGFRWMEEMLPGFNVYLFSDNGPHYHNTAVLLYLAEINDTFNLILKEYNNFEAGEGKTVLDTHFAHISHKLLRWVRVGNNLDSGEQLAEILEVHN
ncbi:hypothetical protein QZH41_008638 [Actinostola sp. cb2023]|nr:hypothetical protein QZH41_008638 [Actinostola sp. cb2023]